LEAAPINRTGIQAALDIFVLKLLRGQHPKNGSGIPYSRFRGTAVNQANIMPRKKQLISIRSGFTKSIAVNYADNLIVRFVQESY